MISLSKLFKSLDEKGAKAENYSTKEVGKHRDISLSKFDPKQVRLGLKIEKEHSDNPDIQAQVTKDHLAEHPFYYSGKTGKTGLVQMEKDLKKEEQS